MAKSRLILFGFLVAGLANVIGHLISLDVLVSYSKPLLMPLLLLYVYENSKGAVTKNTLLLAAAIIFSWGGDLALMNDSLFLLGIGLFLVAQVLYIVLFKRAALSVMHFSFTRTIPVLIYGGVFLFLVVPVAGELAIPVVVYGLILMTMVALSLHRKDLTTDDSYKLVVLGASLFIISDSLLAYSKFVDAFVGHRFFVMLTYIAAQYFISAGIMKHPS